MDAAETICLLRQLAEPVEFNAYDRIMFDYAMLKIDRDYIYTEGLAYFPPGAVIRRVKILGMISRSLKMSSYSTRT